MLENPSDPQSNTLPAPIKRYAPPNQRNRGVNRRKSGDRSDRTSNLQPDGDKNLSSGLESTWSIDHFDTGSSKSIYESFRPRLIALNGCGRSEASQLLHERWKEAIRCYSDPTVDLSERPTMYTGNAGTAWGNFRVPHQFIHGPPMDFLAELQHVMNRSRASSMK
ncbi:uncharacterized protein LOC130818201 [Amaranthus tricolor]|uniref:uncharacterized protein LOC130818201 n=1 Tax=Amaranthus tricolor TaxID=29722 RepID=UPI00258A0D39|nr:uncharacterized protein LOC130818201 [Amaranthus tricolor]